jgi:hypothetical protein
MVSTCWESCAVACRVFPFAWARISLTLQQRHMDHTHVVRMVLYNRHANAPTPSLGILGEGSRARVHNRPHESQRDAVEGNGMELQLRVGTGMACARKPAERRRRGRCAWELCADCSPQLQMAPWRCQREAGEWFDRMPRWYLRYDSAGVRQWETVDVLWL